MAQVDVPFSYLRQVGSPAQSALQGYEQGLQMQASRLQAAQAAEDRQRRLAAEDMQAKLAEQKRQEMASAREAFRAYAAQDRVTAADTARLIANSPPELFESIKSVYEMRTPEQLEADRRSSAQTIFALQSNPEVGLQMLDEQIAAAKNAGSIEEAQGLMAVQAVAKEDPVAAARSLTVMLGPALGEDFVKMALGEGKDLGELKESGTAGGVTRNRYQFGVQVLDNGVPVSPKDAARIWTEAKAAEDQEQKIRDQEDKITNATIDQVMEIGNKAFTDAGIVIESLDNLIKAYNLIDEDLAGGKRVGTGVLESRLSGLYDTTIQKLKVLQGRLALDTLKLVTLGAISSEEQRLLERTAIDFNQEPEDILADLGARINAANKAIKYMQNIAEEAQKNPRDYQALIGAQGQRLQQMMEGFRGNRQFVTQSAGRDQRAGPLQTMSVPGLADQVSVEALESQGFRIIPSNSGGG